MEVNFIRTELYVDAMNHSLFIHDYGINTIGWLFDLFNVSLDELKSTIYPMTAFSI